MSSAAECVHSGGGGGCITGAPVCFVGAWSASPAAREHITASDVGMRQGAPGLPTAGCGPHATAHLCEQSWARSWSASRHCAFHSRQDRSKSVRISATDESMSEGRRRPTLREYRDAREDCHHHDGKNERADQGPCPFALRHG